MANGSTRSFSSEANVAPEQMAGVIRHPLQIRVSGVSPDVAAIQPPILFSSIANGGLAHAGFCPHYMAPGNRR